MSRPLNALIVDDSRTTRKMIMQALDQTGLAEFYFTEADDGIDALGKYQPGQTEIVFVDMNMPRMGGLELVRKLHAQDRLCPPTVMITAESRGERLSEAMSDPAVDAILLKPVDRDRLQAGLRKIVDSIPERSGTTGVQHGVCVPEGVRAVFEQACGIKLSNAEGDAVNRDGPVVLGMLYFRGDVHWSVMMGFAQGAAEAIASKFAGYAVTSEGPDLGDAVGEIVNMVGSKIKQLLGARGVNVTVSLPTVVSAAEFRVLLQHKSAAECTPLPSPMGDVWTILTVGRDTGLVL